MKHRPWISPVVLLITMIGTSMVGVARAQVDGRSMVAGRQQVRAALSVAMADGKLTRPEAYDVLRKGKRVLAAEDLEGLKRTLARLSGRPRVSRVTLPADPAPAEGPQPTLASRETHQDQQNVEGDEAARPMFAELLDETDGFPAASLSYDDPVDLPEPAPVADLPEPMDSTELPDPDEGSPFVEEELQLSPMERLRQIDDVEEMVEEGAGAVASGFIRFRDVCLGDPQHWPDIRLSTSVDAFKGPVDLDNRNGNFGLRFAINAGFPLAEGLGLGIQAGTGEVLTDLHGSPFTGNSIRAQNFTTVGLFQRILSGEPRLKWGFAFDWIHDQYYSTLTMSQWRVKLGYELTPCREIGLWAAIPNDGDFAVLGDDPSNFHLNRFEPIPYGSLYYRRCWHNGANTTAWLGIAEEPGEMMFGADARIPLNWQWAFIGNFNYLLPSASGPSGQDEELWNVSLGIELTLGHGGNHCLANKSSPLFPLADNGSFLIRRLDR